MLVAIGRTCSDEDDWSTVLPTYGCSIVTGMERRHQVFISSTFTDLVEERREVIEALLEMDAIPAGMELFAAGNTDQWTLIQQVIDQSDYYLVIVGGRYGSMTAEGLSYTEMEYDYAVAQGVPVMGFVHADPESIPKGKSEMNAETSLKLSAFREKVMRKIVRMYATPAELGGVVSRGLIRLQRDAPRSGWVRGDLAMTPETEARIAEMRAELAELRQAVSESRAGTEGVPKIEGLASGDDHYDFVVKITGTQLDDRITSPYNRAHYVWTVEYHTTWNEIVHVVGPALMDEASEREITRLLQGLSVRLIDEQDELWPGDIDTATRREMDDKIPGDVLVQLFALGLITHGAKKRTITDHNKYWVLTPAGQDQVMRLRAIRRRLPERIAQARLAELKGMLVSELRGIAAELEQDTKGSKSALIEAILDAERSEALY